MTTGRVAVLRGSDVVTSAQLEKLTDASLLAGADEPGRVVPIVDSNPVRSLATARAVRAAGGVPLLGDDRWDAGFWTRLREFAESVPPAPGAQWATFTSGSTGTPRVVVRSDRSWAMSFPTVTGLLDLTQDDVVYLPAPLASSMSLFSVIHALSAGAAVRLPQAHTVTALDLADATVMHATPTATGAVLDLIERGAAHRLRVALVGGARIENALRRRAAAVGIRVVSYYGAAELSFVAVDVDGTGLRAFDGVELRVADGELWVRSSTFAAGYVGDATGSFRRDDQGWGTVGDLAELTESGTVELHGRADGAILTAAATVVPEDVEAALRSIPGVEDAVVFGLPNAGAGSLVAAVVQTSADYPRPSASELREHARTRLAGTHLPRRWFWAQQLPRTTTGKPARAQIRDDVMSEKTVRLE
ncbi:MAG: long-chain acyl-CoA synthetase [Microbacteriaceae bacterium]|nr:long-chain acyl-CoA synthetase [Microbacteriaceae bacterium]